MSTTFTTTLLPGNILYGGDLRQNAAQNCASVGQYLLTQYKSFGDQAILTDGVSGNVYTGKYIYDKAVRFAYVLQKLGVKQNDVIGLSSENSIEFAITLLGSIAVGAATAPINITYSEREVQHAINLSKPKIIFASDQTVDLIAKIAEKNSFVEYVVCLGTKTLGTNVLSFHALMADKSILSEDNFETPPADKDNDVVLILCSSGTTGLPKGVQLTQNNILVTIDMKAVASLIDYADIAVLTVIPWFHAFGCVTLLTISGLGANLVYLPRFEERLFLSSIEKYRIFMGLMVPPLMVFLAKHPLVDNYDLSSLVVLLSGAAPLSRETEDQIKKRIGVPFIRQGYGLSESTLSILVQNDTHCKPGSVGTLNGGYYAKVIDPDTGKVLGANERGELCFKGLAIMKGYIGDAAATETIIKDGWLHTGDIGYYDNDFEFFIVDRLKELIKYKGFQVPPAEIEALLLQHPDIKDAAVIGIPDEIAGELPMAFVVKQLNALITENDVIEFVKKHASPAKRIRGGVEFVDEIPKNASGKLMRRVLRDMIKTKPKSKL